MDAPGHEALMATMLSGAAVMDGAILVIAANEPCPQPQTREHLAAIRVAGVENIVITQNKIDIVEEKEVLQNYKEIIDFVEGTVAGEAPIIPISAQHSVNIDAVIQALEEHIPTPQRDPAKTPRMNVVRSFDINKPGTPIDKLSGGVLGGTIFQGTFKLEDEIEIRPGIRVEQHKKTIFEPLFTKIVSLHAGGRAVKEAKCGGLVGIGTLLDPSLTKADGLIGNLAGKPETLPPALSEFTLDTHLFERAVGTKELVEVDKLSVNEQLLLDVGTAITTGNVTSIRDNLVTLQLARPVCAEKGFRSAISRKIVRRWRLIGYGEVT